MKNQGGAGCVLVFIVILGLASIIVFGQDNAILIMIGTGIGALVAAGIISHENYKQSAGHAAQRRALAQAESDEQSARARLDRESTERVRCKEGCYQIPDIDGIGQSRTSDYHLPGSWSRPQLDDPDVIDGQVTDIAGWLPG